MNTLPYAAAVLCLSACMSGPEVSSAAAAPAACDAPVYHQFDFWIGEWAVYDPAGNLAGTNSIQPEESGCLLVERWTNTAGGTGQSYNFYDPGIGKWRQIWVNAAGVIDYAGGLTETGAMYLEGEIRNRGAASAPFTGEWTANADGSVTQHFRQQDPETGEWSDWFVGRYVRKSVE
ncbi:hypothetical protein [Hyphomonas jannaschiana]|uniref:hypothetical protein n=1 Tax=Hyphomonas jannaschiana TaxID=86 RepID=UPI0035C6E826